MGIVTKKVSQTEQQTYKGYSRKSLLEIFFAQHGLPRIVPGKAPNKVFSSEYRQHKDLKIYKLFGVGSHPSTKEEGQYFKRFLKGRVCQQYQSSCQAGQYCLIVRRAMYLSISHSSSSSSSFQETTPWGVSQINNSLVVLVIPPGHSLYKPSTLSADKYFSSESKFTACSEPHGHYLP